MDPVRLGRECKLGRAADNYSSCPLTPVGSSDSGKSCVPLGFLLGGISATLMSTDAVEVMGKWDRDPVAVGGK